MNRKRVQPWSQLNFQLMDKLQKFFSLFLIAVVAVIAGCSKDAKIARYRERANKHYAAGQYAEAEVEYMNLLRSYPQDKVAIRQLGCIFFEEGRLPQAFQFLNKARELDQTISKHRRSSAFVTPPRSKSKKPNRSL